MSQWVNESMSQWVRSEKIKVSVETIKLSITFTYFVYYLHCCLHKAYSDNLALGCLLAVPRPCRIAEAKNKPAYILWVPRKKVFNSLWTQRLKQIEINLLWNFLALKDSNLGTDVLWYSVCWCLDPVWSRKSVMSMRFISVSVCY